MEIGIEKERESNKQKEKETNRQKEREKCRYRSTDRKREKAFAKTLKLREKATTKDTT